MAEEEKVATEAPVAVEKSASQAVMIAPVADAERVDKADERNAVFVNLVREDGDIIGLVAYTIYKQNKVDWLHAFQKALGRGPTDAELNAYIIGESTPRRLGTYRHLAGATLSGNGPDAVAETAWLSNSVGSRQVDQRKRGLGWIVSSVLSYAILAAAILVGVWLVARYGLPAAHSEIAARTNLDQNRLNCSAPRSGGTKRSVRSFFLLRVRPSFSDAASKRRPIIQA